MDDARHLSYIFGLRRHPYYEQSRKGVTAIQLAPMTGRKAGLLWKATVDEKESGWRGWEGWLSLFLLCFFVAPVPCIFFEKMLGQVAVSFPIFSH